MELSSSNIKKFLFLYFGIWNFSALARKIKKIYLEKIPYISTNGTF